MKKQVERIKELKVILLGLEMDRDLLEQDLNDLNTDIDNFKIYKEKLEENIKVLKRKKIITIASEFKRIKEQIVTIENRLTKHAIVRDSVLKMLSRKRLDYNKHKEELDHLQQELNRPPIVLPFKRN